MKMNGKNSTRISTFYTDNGYAARIWLGRTYIKDMLKTLKLASRQVREWNICILFKLSGYLWFDQIKKH